MNDLDAIRNLLSDLNARPPANRAYLNKMLKRLVRVSRAGLAVFEYEGYLNESVEGTELLDELGSSLKGLVDEW